MRYINETKDLKGNPVFENDIVAFEYNSVLSKLKEDSIPLFSIRYGKVIEIHWNENLHKERIIVLNLETNYEIHEIDSAKEILVITNTPEATFAILNHETS